MVNSNQFSIAIHILCFLAFNASGRTTSELLGVSVNTNPAAIRRNMRKLTQAGLIQSSLGVHANITLAKPAEQITLLDVYRAVTDGQQEKFFAVHRSTCPTCPVGSKIPRMLDQVYGKVQVAMENELAAVTIASLAGQFDQKE
ncbi:MULTISPECIES: Rrf2 family transcriptional regulator [Paenibacillus]|uniref:Similar to Putative HTH-type transcriptional regulator ywnA acc. no. P71036 n=1 Tax=Pyronema omphalodes (strain CBS 100304) TaxID=1076935 RepID=U4KVT5_PYROM|nr:MULTISPECIES: Rrf2 family transcriptional regulator [Paenibacillus]CCX05743.1 Similar to Putative HTH-type transcriptional regulator ywnA; acc. no. P71036 [Pyronema omphalodes CBS 100304]KGP77448.1 hypothetical protein P364_0133015 [Paenibacillus sp. MAEPY2]KGP78141.1 hypothetical protein P363_0132515 [Paenibacillus sp. MAEPY1]OZQ58907.1 transcriptional regulator [Paenibacillus taichungensis]SFT00583.1 DNA-binding transcriptional regulator, IscR family [Paenibacillus sp. 453mf]